MAILRLCIQDESYEGDEDFGLGGRSVEAGEAELDYIPEMLTRPLSLEAVVGERLELPCSAKVRKSHFDFY